MLVRPTISFEKMGFVIWIKFGQSGAFFSFWQDANFNFAQKNGGLMPQLRKTLTEGRPHLSSGLDAVMLRPLGSDFVGLAQTSAPERSQ